MLGAASLVGAVAVSNASAAISPLALLVGLSSMLFSAMAVTLPSGELLRACGLVIVVAAASLGPGECVIVLFTGSLLGRFSSQSITGESWADHLVGALFSAFLAAVTASVFWLISWFVPGSGVGVEAVGAPLLAGLAYTLGELIGSALLSRRTAARSVFDGVRDLVRTTYSLYFGQVSLGVVTVLLWPSMGLWSLVVLSALGLILLYSFNMYMRVRASYQETIRALGRVSELSFPELDGHAQRVADMAVAVGRRLGMRAKDLENLNYAALLHGIGRVGEEDAEGAADLVAQADRGAAIVERIPFLAGTADLIRYQDSEPADAAAGEIDKTRLSAHIVGVCSRYSIAYKAASDAGDSDPANTALAVLTRDHSARMTPKVLQALADEVSRAHPGPATAGRLTR